MWHRFGRFRRGRNIGIALTALGILMIVAAAPLWFWLVLIGVVLCAAGVFLLFFC